MSLLNSSYSFRHRVDSLKNSSTLGFIVAGLILLFVMVWISYSSSCLNKKAATSRLLRMRKIPMAIKITCDTICIQE